MRTVFTLASPSYNDKIYVPKELELRTWGMDLTKNIKF